MPTYEYACTKCGHRLEAVQKFTDESLTECPDCAGPLRKVYAPVGIVLKGSGFYKTDSRTNGNKKLVAQGADSSAGDAPGDTSPKSDSGSSSNSSADSTSTSDSGAKTETPKPAAATAN